MDLSEYQKLAARTECDQYRSRLRMMGATDSPADELLTPIRLNHAVVGAAGEIGELAAAIEKWIYYGKVLDRVNIKEEIGDILWYMALAATTLGYDLGEIAESNIAKLRIRFPNKFTEEKANNRDLISERKILERSVNQSQPKPNTALHKIPGTTLRDEEHILINVDEDGICEILKEARDKYLQTKTSNTTVHPPIVEQDGHGFGHMVLPDDDPKPKEF